MFAFEGRKDRRWNKEVGVREKMSGENLFLDYSSRGNACGVRIFFPEKDKLFSFAGSKFCWEKQFPDARFMTQRSTPRFSRREAKNSTTPIFDDPMFLFAAQVWNELGMIQCIQEEKKVPLFLTTKKLSSQYNWKRHYLAWFMYIKRHILYIYIYIYIYIYMCVFFQEFVTIHYRITFQCLQEESTWL